MLLIKNGLVFTMETNKENYADLCCFKYSDKPTYA